MKAPKKSNEEVERKKKKKKAKGVECEEISTMRMKALERQLKAVTCQSRKG